MRRGARSFRPTRAAALIGLAAMALAPAGSAAAEDAVARGSIFPLWSQAARDRGAPLPLPYGVGLVAVDDNMRVVGDHLKVRLGKGQAPSSDETLISAPGVSFDNGGSTRGLQLKADVWLFPFLSVFAAVGKVKGNVDIDVVIDADELLPPPICRPADPCGTRHLYFRTPLDNTTATFGGTLIYGTERWFLALSLDRTVSIADGDRSDVSSTNGGLRGGARVALSNGLRFEPYLAVNYDKLDAEVRGTASQDGAFADGEALAVRYDARIRNQDRYTPAIGLNAELGDRWDLQGEYAWGRDGDRLILTVNRRF